MSKPPARFLLWEGLPLLAAFLMQLICGFSKEYRGIWAYEWFSEPDEAFSRVIALFAILFFLGTASVVLYGMRRWWPQDDANYRSFRIAFPAAVATFLTLIAALLIFMAPFWIQLGSDAKWQEEQRHMT